MLLHDYENVHYERVSDVSQIFEYFLADQKIYYICAPISTGARYLNWYKDKGCNLINDLEEFRQSHYNEVITVNRTSAINYSLDIATSSLPHVVFCPACIHFPDWSHDDFMRLYLKIIKNYSKRLIMLPDWQTSLGCVNEYLTAVESNIPCYDEKGLEIDRNFALQSIRDVVPKLIAVKLPTDKISNCIARLHWILN